MLGGRSRSLSTLKACCLACALLACQLLFVTDLVLRTVRSNERPGRERRPGLSVCTDHGSTDPETRRRPLSVGHGEGPSPSHLRERADCQGNTALTCAVSVRRGPGSAR